MTPRAAGRGLKVALCEQGDLAGATSSASSKLIHGGLRYLEQHAFRLVSEALTEREILLKAAPHIVNPATFVLPYANQLRPVWMLCLGLALYDIFGRRSALHRSRRVNLRTSEYGSGLKAEFTRGFIYSDCTVDDARLVVLNAMGAAQLGAQIFTRAKCVAVKPIGQTWDVTLEQDKQRIELRTKILVNATGPWVSSFLSETVNHNERYRVRLVKGSHIVVRRLYDNAHAYILQNEDGRVIFIVPYLSDFTLIGTTDIPYSGDPSAVTISTDEIDYLCNAVNRYSPRSLSKEEVVWAYSGVRPLFDDGSKTPSAVTRGYKLHQELESGGAVLLSVFGGKITTYRKLAETTMDQLRKYLPYQGPSWTASAALPGGDIPKGDVVAFISELMRQYPFLSRDLVHALARRHGSLARGVLKGVKRAEDLGKLFGATLCAREIDYFVEHEWARSVENILWRRTKEALRLDDAEQLAVSDYLQEALRRVCPSSIH